MNWDLISNGVGLVGVSLVVLAYLFLQTGYWKVERFLYSFTNLVGAVLILFSLYFHWNLASVVIEFVWIAISCYRLSFFLKHYLKR